MATPYIQLMATPEIVSFSHEQFPLNNRIKPFTTPTLASSLLG
jgi:hypothetical protein